jgi:hypothetical protein
VVIGVFGVGPLDGYVHFQALHVLHHVRQIPAA